MKIRGMRGCCKYVMGFHFDQGRFSLNKGSGPGTVVDAYYAPQPPWGGAYQVQTGYPYPLPYFHTSGNSSIDGLGKRFYYSVVYGAGTGGLGGKAGFGSLWRDSVLGSSESTRELVIESDQLWEDGTHQLFVPFFVSFQVYPSLDLIIGFKRRVKEEEKEGWRSTLDGDSIQFSNFDNLERTEGTAAVAAGRVGGTVSYNPPFFTVDIETSTIYYVGITETELTPHPSYTSTYQEEIVSANLDGSGSSVLWSGTTDQDFITGLCIQYTPEKKIWFSYEENTTGTLLFPGTAYLKKMNVGGGGLETILSGNDERMNGIQYSHSKDLLYYSQEGKMKRIKPDGSGGAIVGFFGENFPLRGNRPVPQFHLFPPLSELDAYS